MFLIDSDVKQEALNFATLMNVLGYTDHRLEPLFEKLTESINVGIPLTDQEVCKKYAAFFDVAENELRREYTAAQHAFSRLHAGDEVIKRGSLDYPPLLEKTDQAPRFLYIRGNKSLLYEKRAVAVVGSRQASEQAKANTRMLTRKLGENGIAIISGLAKGIDVTAHTEALRHGYNTVAVIGTSLNQYYPAENKGVRLEIEKKGLVVSQFSPAAKTQRWFFPLRNGVMSGLSLATVIMEAGETSGALKQADFALRQGRQVIIPRSIVNQKSVTWPQRYIDKGASVVAKPSDVLRVLSENKVFNPALKKDGQPVQRTLAQHMMEIGGTELSSEAAVWARPMMAQ